MYKVNYLHLTDDQGWRIAIDKWPRLTSYGGGSEVGGGAGGFYTKDDYREIVAYAAQRFMTVVPEVDLPGHTNAALASYPELNCDATARPRYTGTDVGFSTLCVPKDITYRFLDDVIGELADLTPGPYLHIGGDEATTLAPTDYAAIVTRAQDIVASHGKTAIGWHELAKADLKDGTVFQYWNTTIAALDLADAAAAGHKMILSPANHAYLDQKYDDGSPIGLAWAGPTSVEEAYGWDPASYLSGVGEDDILGVESPLWTETVASMDDIEYLGFPRLAAVAEIGWSPPATHDWSSFRNRLGAQAPRWRALGVDFAEVPDVPWVSPP
jgi:hexosaminidase